MTDQVSRARLQREWVLCAIAVAAARFVPVPFVDELIKTRATRTAVAHTWTAHRRPEAPTVIGILADDTASFWGGLVRSAARLPFKLIFYPIRKVVRMVTAVRGVSADLVGVVLLARSIDRCLASGWFTSPDPRTLEQQALLVRRAHDQVIGNADLRVLNQAVGSALRQVGGLRTEAEAFARRVFGRGGTTQDAAQTVPGALSGGTATTAQEAQVDQGVERIVAVLDRPEITRILAELDQRFDRALAALAPASGAGPAGVPPAQVTSGQVTSGQVTSRESPAG